MYLAGNGPGEQDVAGFFIYARSSAVHAAAGRIISAWALLKPLTIRQVLPSDFAQPNQKFSRPAAACPTALRAIFSIHRHKLFKRKRKGIRVSTLTALGTLSFFACLRGHPAIRKQHYSMNCLVALRSHSVAPQDCLLEPRFPLFLRHTWAGQRALLSRKNSPFPCSARLRERQSPLSRIRLAKVRFCRALLHYLITSQRLLTLMCNLVSSHLRKLRLAHARLRERASLSNGNAWHLPRFIYKKANLLA